MVCSADSSAKICHNTGHKQMISLKLAHSEKLNYIKNKEKKKTLHLVTQNVLHILTAYLKVLSLKIFHTQKRSYKTYKVLRYRWGEKIIYENWPKYHFFFGPETISPLHVRSKVCMAPFHVQSKVCKSLIQVRSKFAHFAPHMEGSHVDIALHIEWRHSFMDQQKLVLHILPIFKKNLFNPP